MSVFVNELMSDRPVTATSNLVPQPPITAGANGEKLPVIAIDMPVMFEDEGQENMGEADFHVITNEILHNGLCDHLLSKPRYRTFSNLNVYYHPIERWAYVSPDTLVVEPYRPLPANVTSYRIGKDGPAPLLTIEVLSRRSFQQQDLTNKPAIYAQLGVSEYILVDVTGIFLPQRLLLNRLQADGSWTEEQDDDGGVTSRLGFRLIVDDDGHVRVLDEATGKPYARPPRLRVKPKHVAERPKPAVKPRNKRERKPTHAVRPKNASRPWKPNWPACEARPEILRAFASLREITSRQHPCPENSTSKPSAAR